jgi:hypothetical protein
VSVTVTDHKEEQTELRPRSSKLTPLPLMIDLPAPIRAPATPETEDTVKLNSNKFCILQIFR